MRFVAPAFVALVTAISGFALMGGPGAARGTGDATSSSGARGFGQVSLANCEDYKRASPSERSRVVDRLGGHFRSSQWAGHSMEAGDARAALDRACSRRESRNIKLYKIYARALAFSPMKVAD